MVNNGDTHFKELEKLNTQFDIWIDDEEYHNVENRIVGGDRAGQQEIKVMLDKFFDQSNFCTVSDDKETIWQELLNVDHKEVPKIKEIPIGKNWFYLFYAKLLRAKILQRDDSACYIRRLDDVATYLESHIPNPQKDDGDTIKLLLMYLMELSAISMSSESQGYSERARRIILAEKHRIALYYKKNQKPDNETPEEAKNKAKEKAPYEFYELWATYNIGVAYFHQHEYQKAVQEFNKIIWQIEKWNNDANDTKDKNKKDYIEATACLIFFNDEGYKGKELLFLPAKLYRTEVQLKLQMAYHTLDTLNKHEENNKDKFKGWKSKHRLATVNIRKAQAYQLLGRLDKSWVSLKEIYSSFNEKDLGTRKSLRLPKIKETNTYPSLRERFFDILIEDHLQWLCLDGEDKKKDDKEDLRHLIKYGKLTPSTDKKGISIQREPCGDYFKGYDSFKGYLDRLLKAFEGYWGLVKDHADNRNGYFQQVAKYLEWLSKAADWETKECKDCKKDYCKKTRGDISIVASNLFKKAEDYGILQSEPGINVNDDSQSPSECQYCPRDGTKGIDLRRIEDEHYEWFTKAMMKFFDSKSIKEYYDKKEEFRKNKKKFVNRLIQLERKDRNDLRIKDLKLQYDYYESAELLDGDGGVGGMPQIMVDWRRARIAQILCRGETISNEFSGLLACAPRNKDEAAHDYEKVISDWKSDFVRHLESSSIHEHDTKINQYYFAGLQRWNSSSPAKGYSVGGGYLLYRLGTDKQVDLGIAIDPGFDFVRNLFHSGFGLDDIDIILLSHAHVDHIRDFESIITLMNELKKETKRERRVHVILSLSTYKRLKHVIESPGLRYFIEPYIIDINREIDENYFEKLGEENYCRNSTSKDNPISFKFEHVEANGQAPNRLIERFRAVLPDEKDNNKAIVEIMPTRAYHNDHTNYSDSFGFKIKLNKEDSKEEITFGYTGDTKWIYPNMTDILKKRSFKDIAEQYKDCDALVVHLGSLIKKKAFADYNQCKLFKTNHEYPCEDLVQEENHPYLVGMLRLLASLSYFDRNNGKGKPLIMISEFGEELKGSIRTDFVRRLQKSYKDKLVFLPVDVGMNIELCSTHDALIDKRGNKCNCRVWCVQCQKYVNINDADFEMYGNDNALYCVCRTCKKATPDDVLQTKLRKLYEVGYEIKTRMDNDNKHS